MRAIFILLIIVPTAHAEITNCSGVWTNQDCEQAILSSFDEQASQPRKPEDIIKDQAKLVIHKLETVRFKAKRQYDLDFIVTDAIETCKKSKKSLEECNVKASAKLEEMLNKINALKKEEKKEAENKPKQEPVTIRVVEDRRYYDYYWLHKIRNRNTNSPKAQIKPNIQNTKPVVQTQPKQRQASVAKRKP